MTISMTATGDLLQIDIDQLQQNIASWNNDKASAEHSLGIMRQSIGEYTENTGINKKALSMIRALDKMPEEKRTDVLRSLFPMLNGMMIRWGHDATQDMFDGGEVFDNVVSIADENADAGGDDDLDFLDPDADPDEVHAAE